MNRSKRKGVMEMNEKTMGMGDYAMSEGLSEEIGPAIVEELGELSHAQSRMVRAAIRAQVGTEDVSKMDALVRRGIVFRETAEIIEGLRPLQKLALCAWIERVHPRME